MSDEEKHGAEVAQPVVETVPKTEHEKVKTGLLSELSQLRMERASLKKELSQLKTTKIFNPEDLSETERLLHDKAAELAKTNSQLAERESQIADKERKITAKELSGKHGVAEEELLRFETLAEMERFAKDYELETLRKAHKESKEKEKQPARPKFEPAGGSPVSQKPIWEMNKEEFEAHTAKMRREAAAKR